MSAGHDASPRQAGAAVGGDYSIEEVRSSLYPGIIGVARCPGTRKGAFVADRLLPDLDAVEAWGADSVIALLAGDEVAGLPIDTLQFEVRRRDIGLVAVDPSDDIRTPEGLEREWQRLRGRLLDALRHGCRLLVICSDGGRRGGRLIGWLLIEGGATAEEALERVGAVCPEMLAIPEEGAAIRDYRPPG